LVSQAADSSFPSTSTLIAVALGGPFLWRRPRLGAPLVIWGIVVGMARVAAAVHYPSDVLGSALIGLALSALATLVAGRVLASRGPTPGLQRASSVRPPSDS
jgi:membrane-associated phospholipid phosphatase